MFKKENRIWWYLLGAFIMMAFVAYIGYNYVLPFILGRRDVIPDTRFFYSAPPAYTLQAGRDYRAAFVTNFGVFRVDLFENSAPQNVNNFVFLANQGYYENTKFHRLIPNLLLQGGDRLTLDSNPDNDGRGGNGYFINDELNWDAIGLSESQRATLTAQGFSSNPNLSAQPLNQYSLAVANVGPNTNGPQFFFVIGNDPRLTNLQGRFTVIGRVIDGFDVMNNIARVSVNNPDSNNPRPQTDIVIRQVLIF